MVFFLEGRQLIVLAVTLYQSTYTSSTASMVVLVDALSLADTLSLTVTTRIHILSWLMFMTQAYTRGIIGNHEHENDQLIQVMINLKQSIDNLCSNHARRL